MSVTCPFCGATYSTPEEVAAIAGLGGLCPACGADLAGLGGADGLILGDLFSDGELDGDFR